MPQAMKDIRGQVFGNLTAIERSGVDAGGNVLWRCRCACGNETVVRGGHLRGGQVKCCGGKGRGCRRFFRSDITGRVFGRLTVLGRNGHSAFKKQRSQRWDCRCECGSVVNVLGSQLRSGQTQSCGCLARERLAQRSTTHGLWGSTKYRLLHAAKGRAKVFGVPFDLELSDIVIPDHCPLLGVRLSPGRGKPLPGSPSLDRIIPALGYVKGNVWVISQKANQMKSDLTLDQLKHFVRVIEQRMASAG